MRGVLECVMNVSEGARADVVNAIAAGAGGALLDVHSDAHHNRSVLTLAGPDVESAAQAVTRAAVERLDLRMHVGVHPRIGVVDVVPFVPLTGSEMADAVTARDRFAAWVGDELGVPCFLYGDERSLPEIRRGAFTTIPPATGPRMAHPTAGAVAVGARPLLVAYNVWLAASSGVDVARAIAAAIRGPAVRALGLDVGGRAQVSCNLIDPAAVGPGALVDAVASRAEVAGTELVGLVPASVLADEPPARWRELDLDASRTIEARLERAGLDGGRRM
jgi:glutamate formiminotransferase